MALDANPCQVSCIYIYTLIYQESFQEELAQTMEAGAQWCSKIVEENGIEDDFPASDISQMCDINIGKAMFEVLVCEYSH